MDALKEREKNQLYLNTPLFPNPSNIYISFYTFRVQASRLGGSSAEAQGTTDLCRHEDQIREALRALVPRHQEKKKSTRSLTDG